ncbi:MAG: hypothetical protein QOD07_130 [Frankiaceae bacterium]|nr:hypothetical protein [Frankiaceae bacterium]
MSSPALRRVSLVAVLALTGIGTLSLTGVSRADSGAGNSFTPYVVTDGSKTVNGGEPSLGVDPKTNAVVYGAGGHETQMTFDDSASPATVTQKDVSAPTAVTTLDAITFVDQHTGRLFDSQLLGLCSGMSYSDDDGASWQPTTGCGQNTFLDHQSVGGGPFHAPIPAGADPLYPDAVYYCAQNGFNASCAVSLDGGLSFGPGQYISDTPANDPTDPNPTFAAEGGACSGLHGHIRVGPDGTVYVPLKGCGGTPTANNLTNSEYFGGQPAVSVSKDNGATWTVHMVPGAHNQDESDNAVDVDKSGRLWMTWEDGTNPDPNSYGTLSSERVAYSDDEGTHWSKPVDLSTMVGVHNVQFPEIIAGDKGRAAVAFIGTNAVGNDQHVGFVGPDGLPAVWHLYVSMTYDNGKHWTTIDTTPKDPVQRGCVLMEGTSNKTVQDAKLCNQRNLLDFNDITMDDHGRVYVAYTDGCFDACVVDRTVKSKGDRDMVMRLSGGKGLIAKYDGTLGAVPHGTTGVTTSVVFMLPLATTAAVARRRRAELVQE